MGSTARQGTGADQPRRFKGQRESDPLQLIGPAGGRTYTFASRHSDTTRGVCTVGLPPGAQQGVARGRKGQESSQGQCRAAGRCGGPFPEAPLPPLAVVQGPVGYCGRMARC